MIGIPSTMPEVLQYYAGFIDGEGHIGIKKSAPRQRAKNPIYTERISVAGTNERTIRGFQEIWPGSLHYHKPGKNSRSGYWSWELTNKKARDFINIIRPYLRIKGLDASIVLALGKLKEQTNRSTISRENMKLRDDLYRVLKAHRRILWEK